MIIWVRYRYVCRFFVTVTVKIYTSCFELVTQLDERFIACYFIFLFFKIQFCESKMGLIPSKSTLITADVDIPKAAE